VLPDRRHAIFLKDDMPNSPLAVVQAQLDAYNAKDLDALMATYAPNAQQFALHGALLA